MALVGTLISPGVHAAEPFSFGPALQPFVERHEIPGAVVLVADKDKLLDIEAIGYADIQAQRPMQPDALFWVASMTKPMTAAALMMLVEEGKVRVDDPVEKYLPEFKGQMVVAEKGADFTLLKKPLHPVTIKNLLNHTSGLPGNTEVDAPTEDLISLASRIKHYGAIPLQFQPGTKYVYSNPGINTIARVVEVVSGLPFETFLRERLLEPLGMSDTTFWPTASQLKRLAASYRPNSSRTNLDLTPIDQLRYPLDDRLRQPYPAGGLFSTASDLLRFCQMILNGGVWQGRRYLSESSVKEMSRNQQNLPGDSNGYGFGWQTTASGSFGHGGAYDTNMTIDPHNGLIMIWLIQVPGSGARGLVAFHRAALAQYARP